MKTRIDWRKKAAPVTELGFPERVALFVSAVHRAQAEALLSGLAEPARERALAFAEDMKTWDSGRRQARLAHEFGVRADAGERIQALVVRTSGDLRAAIVASLPPAVRSQFPQFQGGAEAFPVAVRALAARLVREASR